MSSEKNYKSPRLTRARSRAAAPLLDGAEERLKPTLKPTPKLPPNPPQNYPEIHPQNHPRNHPAQPLPNNGQTSTSRCPEIRPAFCWVRTGSALGLDWVRASYFGKSTTYRYNFQSTATPSNLPKTRYKSTHGPSKTPPDPARTQHRTHHETPDFIGRPSCPYSFYIKDL